MNHRWRKERKDPVHLAHPLLVDGLALVRIGEFVADQERRLVVLVGGAASVQRMPGVPAPPGEMPGSR